MSRWSHFDEWDPETDPALRRTHEALAQAAQEPRRAAEPIEADTGSCDPEPALPESSKQARVSQLVARIRAGDLSAVDALRRLIE